jgi:carbon-monoxide dehydrogenase large subunit
VPLNKGRELSTTVYRLPVAAVRGRAVHSNTSPLSAYRSAGRPQVMFVMERLIDLAARRHGFDRVALRRRNLIPPGAMPYTNAFGIVYDSGDYPAALDRVLALADWAGFEARRAEARRRGRYRGIGLASYIEIATGAPRERAQVTARPDGWIDVVIGTLSAGQGHETAFAQLIAEWLGVEPERVRLVAGDTDRVAVGGGSHSGRSMRLGGVVMAKAADRLIARGARLAAWLLESAVEDVEFSERRFRVRGTDRAVDLFAVAAAALRAAAPDDLLGPLEGECDETVSTPSFPYGSAVCEVEVDPEIGVVEIVRYSSVDDVGRAINPLIVHGQTHGGLAQGVGEALCELCDYDPESGQLRSATFMDYAMPRADLLPSLATEISEVESTSNPLGLRGGGEGGTTPALGAVVNAVCDALAELGVEHLEMPVTPERVWRAIRAARG